MRMVITTGELEEGAHHVSEELYKKVMLLIMSETHPEWSRPTPRAADVCPTTSDGSLHRWVADGDNEICLNCGTRR